MIKDYGLVIGKCVYEETDQQELIRSFIMGTIDPTRSKNAWSETNYPIPHFDDESELNSFMCQRRSELGNIEDKKSRERHEIASEVIPKILAYAPFIKHPSFSEESEWRVVIIDRFGSKFRQGKSFIVPYLEIPLSGEDPVRIEKAIVGPTPHKDLAKQSCSKFLGIGNVINSDIPYRNW